MNYKYGLTILRQLFVLFVIILIIQFGWNEVSPLYGYPELTILQSIGLFASVYLSVYCISVAWHSAKNQ